jgi:uncharacterized membrane protein
MAVRFLVMLSLMVVELGAGIAGIVGVCGEYPFGLGESGISLIVVIVAAIVVSWLLTIAFFARASSRAKANRLLDEARIKAAKILGDATDKALALCSMDQGKCDQCGNPRTGNFCPKCGARPAIKNATS